MSIHTVTVDELLQLTPEEHQEAVDLYDQAISDEIANGHTLEADYDQFAESRDRLGRLLTLRKVHQGRLDELESQQPAPRLASQQYFDNELGELPS